MKNVLLGVVATISMAAASMSLAQMDQMGQNGQAGAGNYGEANGQAGSPQMNGQMNGTNGQMNGMNGQMNQMNGPNAGKMTRVTLKINAPTSLIRQQRDSGQANMITLGNRSFRVPAGLESITVLADLGKLQMGQNIPVRIAYNNSDCRIEISGRPMQMPNRKITITVREQKGEQNQMQGSCDKAVISGER